MIATIPAKKQDLHANTPAFSVRMQLMCV